jgi:protoporphyrin/coproporphyrin ferrochelatase
MSSEFRRAVLLLAHGTPETLDEIPDYLRNVTSGRPLPQHVIDEIRHRYSLIGHSPLTDITMAQAAALQESIGLPVYVGMRNWKPYVVDTVKRMREDGIQQAVAICLAPQNSRTSVGLYKRAAYAEAGTALELDFIDAWADHPLLIEAFAAELCPLHQRLIAQAGAPVPVIFTAHSVPCRTVWSATSIPLGDTPPPADAKPATPQQPDPYPQDAKRTAQLVAASLGLSASEWFFAFQSQGASGGPWIGPAVEDTLRALAAAGKKQVLIQPIGFLCDHVEILYDIDIAFRDLGKEIGIDVQRTPSLNTSPRLVDALADLTHQGLARLEKR